MRKLLLKSQGFAGAEALLWIFSSFVDGRVSSIKVRIHSLNSSQSLVCCIVGILESGWLSSGLSTAHLAENLEGIFKGVTSGIRATDGWGDDEGKGGKTGTTIGLVEL